MKKYFKYLFAFMAVLTLSACTIKEDSNITIDEEGKVTLRVTQAYDRDTANVIVNVLDSMKSPETDESGDEEEPVEEEEYTNPEEVDCEGDECESDEPTDDEKTEFVDHTDEEIEAAFRSMFESEPCDEEDEDESCIEPDPSDPTIEVYHEDDMFGVTMTLEVEDIDLLSSSTQFKTALNGMNGEDGKLFYKNGNVYSASWILESTDNSQYSSYNIETMFSNVPVEIKESLNEMTAIVKIQVELPFEPISNNAHTVSEDGKTLSWQLEETAVPVTPFEPEDAEAPTIEFAFELDKPVNPTLPIDEKAIISSKVSGNAIKLTWNNVISATKYDVYMSSTSSKKGFKKVASNLTTPTYTASKLTYGKTYYFKVVAKNNNNSTTSSVKSVVVKPVKVTNLKAIPDSTTVKLTWDKANASGYIVAYSTDGGKKWKTLTTINKSSTTTYTHKKLTSNKNYTYKVLAFGKNGSKQIKGAYSSELTVKTAPAAPTETVKAVDYKQLNVTVKAVSGASTYEVYRSTDKKNYTKVTTLTKAGTYKDSDVLTNTTYYYKTKACNSASICGSYSKVLSAKPTLGKVKFYDNFSVGTKSEINFSLGYVEGATSYQYVRSTSKNGKYSNPIVAEYSQIIDNDLKAGKTYYYKARACRLLANENTVCGPWSSVATGKTYKSLTSQERANDIVKLLTSSTWGPSKKSLYNSLVTSEGFTKAQVDKAIKNNKVNFNTQAYKFAKAELTSEYSTGLSAAELKRDMIENENFTTSEYKYAINKLKPDYNKQALKAAKYHLDNVNFSESGIRSYLLNDRKFTSAQVNYAIKNGKFNFNAIALRTLEDNEPIDAEAATALLDNLEFTEANIAYAIDAYFTEN